ncbi:MAG: cytochrome P450 [Pseudomonadota bacterium]
MSALDLRTFDLRALPDAFYNNPFPTYAALQAREPIKQMPDGSLLLTRYEDCMRVYRDTGTFSSDKHSEFLPKFGDTPLFEHHTTSLVFNDPPLHTRVRKIIMGALSARAMALVESQVTQLVSQLLDDMEAKEKAGDPIDFVSDFAAAIPIEVIGNLLGVPHAQRDPLRGWSLAILGALEPQLTPEQERTGNTAVTAFLAYIRTLVEDRRRHPGDPDQDLLTRLIEGEPQTGTLSEPELLHNCIFILNAGHETTTNIIASAVSLFAENMAARQMLLDDMSLMPLAIEECLRVESPNQLGNRITTEETHLGDVLVPKGTRITLCIGAANRDAQAFEKPEHFDIVRKPNRHLAFASGAHQCAGMHVARLEARIALAGLLARFPTYALAKPIVRAKRARFRGFSHLGGVLRP